jgi:hypothetical protein
MITSCLTSWTGTRFCSVSREISGATGEGVLMAKLKLLCERVIQPLAILKLLAGGEMDSPLLRLMFLPGQ